MRSALARHDAILNAAIGEHRGFLVEAGREGDSVLASFSRAGDAVGAALAIQRRFREQDWPEGGELRIRVALHTGEAEYRAGHYYGQAVYRCARLLAAANGGQVLLSQATRQVAGDELPKGVALIDHGEHRLKDLVRPERIFQLADAQAPPDRRAIRSLDRRLNNLPAQLTPLFGREDDLRRLTAAAARGRLLTLTGAGGSGKTRLAIDLASRLAGAHADGAWLVELGPLADPRAVAPAILHTLGVTEQPKMAALDRLLGHLDGRALLLVLDNCEHLVESVAATAARLLANSAELRILATSREPLGVAGEVTWPVTPLPLEDAVALFLERARRHRADFKVDAGRRHLAIQVCRRLDGIPLAVELAAAQVDALPLEEIASRLDHRFALLTGGARAGPARQQTLEAAVDWSYQLLAAREKTLLRRLSVLSGGFDLAAAEAVAGGAGLPDSEVVPALVRLVRKSLLVADQDRYRMLETIRQFGLERLQESGEAGAVQRRLAHHLLVKLRSKQPGRLGEWLDAAELDHDDLRQSFGWATAEEPDLALQLARHLFEFWNLRGYVAEGRLTCDAVLVAAAPGSEDWIVCLANSAALAYLQGDNDEAVKALRRAVTTAESSGFRFGLGRSLYLTAVVNTALGDPVRAEAAVEDALPLWQELGDGRMEAETLHQVGLLAAGRGDVAGARALFERSLARREEAGYGEESHITLTFLGAVLLVSRDLAGAAAATRQGLELAGRLGDRRAAWALDVRACLAAAAGRPREAMTLAGAAEAMHSGAGTRPPETWRALNEGFLGRARAELGEAVARAAWEEGGRVSYAEAIQLGLALGEA